MPGGWQTERTRRRLARQAGFDLEGRDRGGRKTERAASGRRGVFLFGWPVLRPGEGRKAKGRRRLLMKLPPAGPRPRSEMMSWDGAGSWGVAGCVGGENKREDGGAVCVVASRGRGRPVVWLIDSSVVNRWAIQ